MAPSKNLAKQAKKKSSKATKGAKQDPSTSKLSTEYIQDSDIEEESQEKPNPEPESQESSGSDQESLLDNAASIPTKITIPPAGSSSSSEDENESDELSSEDEEQPGARSTKLLSASNTPKQAAKQLPTKTVTFQQPAPFKPPPGFENSSIDDSLKASKLLKKSNLEGKQIWYITAPASVSISSIEKISLQDIKDGKPILLHEGNNYGFAQDIAQDKTYRNIMAPSESNDGYCTVPKPIDQLLHLQRVIDLPGASTDPNFTSARATVPAKKPVRPQPKGLQMRFLPIGFGSGNAGRIGSGSSDESGSTESTSDEEVEDGPAKPQRPTSSAPVESGSSSDSSEDESSSESDVEMTDAPILPSKSAIKPKSGEEIPITTGGLKRKHGEGSDIKSKQSSSKSTFSTDDRLKRMKTKQNESQIAGSQSVSTKAPKPKVSQTPTLPSTIHPPKTPQFPQPSSSALPPPSVPRTGVKSTPIRPSSQVVRPISSAARPVSTPSKSDDKPPSRDSKTKLSLEDQIKAIDPNLTAEERNQEARRLRRNESSRISKAKARDSLPKLVDEGKGSEAVKSSPAILPSRHLSPISQAIDNSIAQSQSTTIPAKNSREKKDKKKRKRESE